MNIRFLYISRIVCKGDISKNKNGICALFTFSIVTFGLGVRISCCLVRYYFWAHCWRRRCRCRCERVDILFQEVFSIQLRYNAFYSSHFLSVSNRADLSKNLKRLHSIKIEGENYVRCTWPSHDGIMLYNTLYLVSESDIFAFGKGSNITSGTKILIIIIYVIFRNAFLFNFSPNSLKYRRSFRSLVKIFSLFHSLFGRIGFVELEIKWKKNQIIFLHTSYLIPCQLAAINKNISKRSSIFGTEILAECRILNDDWRIFYVPLLRIYFEMTKKNMMWLCDIHGSKTEKSHF